MFFAAEMSFEVALFLETYSVLKTPGCTPAWPPWLADKGYFWLLDELEHSLFQSVDTLKSLYFKAYFSLT